LKIIKCLRNLVLSAMLLSAGVAHAGLLQFQITGDYTATWTLDSNPTPDLAGEEEGFVVWDVDYPDALLGVADIWFYNAAIGGGLQIEDYYGGYYFLVTDGPQLYTGSEFDPTFLTGTFNLTEYLGTGSYVLTITELDAPGQVPEPATGALLIGGLGLLAAARKRRQAN